MPSIIGQQNHPAQIADCTEVQGLGPRRRTTVSRWRGDPGWPCAVLLVAGVLSLVLGGVALYARHAVLDQRAFADRATATLRQDEVRDEIAQRIADREIAGDPGARGAPARVRRPRSPRSSRAPSSPGEFHAGATALHRLAVRRRLPPDRRFALPGAAKELRDAVARHSPSAAAMIPPARPAAVPESAAAGSRARLRSAAPRGARPVGAGAVRPPSPGLLAALRRRAAGARTLRLRNCGGPRSGWHWPEARSSPAPRSAARSCCRPSTRATATRSSGRSGVRSLADLRVWGLILGGARDRSPPRSSSPGRPGAWRRAVARAHGAARQRRTARARRRPWFVLAVLLLWMPEVPLDLALVTFAGLLVFSGAAEVVRLAQRSLIR